MGRIELKLYNAAGKLFAENSYELEVTERLSGVYR